jgi:hypothetical protein
MSDNAGQVFGGAGALFGQPTTVNVQQMTDLVTGQQNLVRALANIFTAITGSFIALAGANVFTGANTFQAASTFAGTVALEGSTSFTLPIKPPKYTVAGLPAVTTAATGEIAYATNARNAGQGSGDGTGALVAVDNTGAWAIVGTGVAPTA